MERLRTRRTSIARTPIITRFQLEQNIISTYSRTLLKNLFSILLTSFLKASTSCQQSKGRLSLFLKQVTSSSFAFSTFLSPTTSSLNFRLANFFFSSSVSFCTLARLRSGLLDDGAGVSDDILSCSSLRLLVCSSANRDSSV